MTETITLASLNAPQNREDFKSIKKRQNEEPIDMAAIRSKYALKQDAFIPLHDLLKDTLPAYELMKLLHK